MIGKWGGFSRCSGMAQQLRGAWRQPRCKTRCRLPCSKPPAGHTYIHTRERTGCVAQLLDGPDDGEEDQAAAHNVHQVQDVLPAAGGRAGRGGGDAAQGRGRCSFMRWRAARRWHTAPASGARPAAAGWTLDAYNSREPGLCCGRELVQVDDGHVGNGLQRDHGLQASWHGGRGAGQGAEEVSSCDHRPAGPRCR